MDFGVTGKLGGYYLAEQYRKNAAADKNRGAVIQICFGKRGLNMSILGVNGALAGAYQYANRTQKTGTSRTSFTEQLQKTKEAADTSKLDAYTEYLRSKYGNVRIQSIGKDQKSLDRAGKSMSGSDVVIAPNILEQMAKYPEKAAYYEGKIDDFFEATPRLKASFAEGMPLVLCLREQGSQFVIKFRL